MSKKKTKTHPDALKAMARFTAFPDMPKPRSEEDSRLAEIISNPFDNVYGVTSRREKFMTEYSGFVELQVSHTDNARYAFPSDADTRSMLLERYLLAMERVLPEIGADTSILESDTSILESDTSTLELVSCELQKDLASYDKIFTEYKTDKVSKRYINNAVGSFVKLSESLGMMKYCHKILAKHNLDI